MKPIVLEGHGVRLEPLAREHREGLEKASADPSVWAFAPEAPGYTPALHFEAWFSRSLGQVGSAAVLPFAVRRLSDDTLVGSTRYLNAALEHARVEVGNTWYAPDARASFINPACKLLLMEHAFTVLNVNRFELKADTRNARSRRAMAGVGATEEGVLRKHMVLGDGYVRDTIYFSVLKEEWPAVKMKLLARLKA